ncbi:hypothetical protein [Synechococcus sp. UW179A]|uniref:hypothetical protein n=1 Tax=Synechococcus sp. UW179A TaxID=2575510 RepID=UPI000E0F6D9F|nr:hypothetical protein [Synechococcus sp. UW179A]
MKSLLVLGALLLSATPTLSKADEMIGDSSWKSGNGQLKSGAMVTWKTFDATSGDIFYAFLMPSKNNLFIDNVQQWSIGVVNCKTGDMKFDYIFDTDKPFDVEKKTKKAYDMTNGFCEEYFNTFKDSPYYKQEAI